METSVTYLGHVIDDQGIHPDPDKVKAIKEALDPCNLQELRSFLGLINYYNRFLPRLSTTLTPLHELLQKGVRWHWGRKQQIAFKEAKRKLSHQVLACYDPHVDIVVSCDASPYGVGAFLSHGWANGTERPVAFASRSLNNTEKKYSQLDKKALALVFGVDKFHKYLFGRLFTLTTDHKPLLGLFQEGKAISEVASSRVQRWGLKLAAYTYHLRYRAGSQNGNADALSRLPLQV